MPGANLPGLPRKLRASRLMHPNILVLGKAESGSTCNSAGCLKPHVVIHDCNETKKFIKALCFFSGKYLYKFIWCNIQLNYNILAVLHICIRGSCLLICFAIPFIPITDNYSPIILFRIYSVQLGCVVHNNSFSWTALRSCRKDVSSGLKISFLDGKLRISGKSPKISFPDPQ